MPDSRRRWLALLEPPAKTPRWGWVESCLLVLWFVVAGFGVAQHSAWADEAQAWLLARGLGWKALFLQGLHYEGTGGLWHAFLKVLQACGVSFRAMRWVVLAVEGGAMALLLRFAPLPSLVRWLLPFTFFLLYQDAVVARSYCLFAILAFAAAALLRGGKPRVLLLALLLGLMANLSVHAAVCSGGFALAAALRWRGLWLRNSMAMLLLVLLWIMGVSAMVPAPDIDYQAGNNLRRSISAVENHIGMHSVAPPSLTGMKMANLPQLPILQTKRHGFAKTWSRVARMISPITYPLSESRLLALVLVLCILTQAWLLKRDRRFELRTAGFADQEFQGSLGSAGLLPYGLMVIVFASLYLAPRHAGTLLTGFVATAWLTWPQRGALTGRRLLFSQVTAALFAVVCVFQISWSIQTLAHEHARPYGPGRMTADYLRSQGVGEPAGRKTLAGYYYFSIDPLLYFGRNIYENQPPHAYWSWSTSLRSYSTVQKVLAERPDFIVVGGFDNGPEAEIDRDWETLPKTKIALNDTYDVAHFFEERGYRATHVFCGHSWMRLSYAETLCDTILEPALSR